MSENRIKLIRDSLLELEPIADVFCLTLFGHLFKSAPEVRDLFQTETSRQGRKFLALLNRAAEFLDQWSEFVPELESLGRRHGYFGVRSEMYPVFQEALLTGLRNTLANRWNPELETAWITFHQSISEVMIRASAEIESTDIDTTIFFRERSE